MGDVCAGNNAGPNTAYEFPCLRVSAMDLFEESGYDFDEQSSVTWYDELITKRLVNPRISCPGIMQAPCTIKGSGKVDVYTN